MGVAGRTVIATAALLGAAVFSQAPEFAQQYRQRLGGALDELRVIVADFDADAGRAGLDRPAALSLYDASEEPFLHGRGQSMRRTITRHETLEKQSIAFVSASPMERPIVLIWWADRQIVTNAWRDFLPAVPLTAAGLVWGAAGASLAAGLMLLMRRAAGLLTRRRHRPEAAVMEPK